MKRRLLLALPAAHGLAGCADLGYRARALNGHLELLSRAERIEQLLLDPTTSEPTRRMLMLAQRLRRFASEQLALPDNASYTRYVPLSGPSVVWNLVATPAYSLQPKTWCFPVMGCVAYRGHFDRARAEAEAAQLQAEGWEVHLYGVPAYSSLGWSRILGGDPLLSSMARWGAPELARLLFHELAHQRAYAADDSAFNEGYATAVEQLGLQAWWAAHPDPALQAHDAMQQQRRARWQARAAEARAALASLYAAAPPDVAARKAQVFAALRQDLDAWAAVDAGYAPYRAWAREANNAHLAGLATYRSRVPDFLALFERLGGHWPRFHAEVARRAALPSSLRFPSAEP